MPDIRDRAKQAREQPAASPSHKQIVALDVKAALGVLLTESDIKIKGKKATFTVDGIEFEHIPHDDPRLGHRIRLKGGTKDIGTLADLDRALGERRYG